MRWFWVDRFTEFVSGSHASGIKNVALDEEVLDGYMLGYPVFPPTLIIEGLAQLGGVLVHEIFGFQKRVVLAKVGKVIYHQPALAGDQLIYRVRVEGVSERGATITGTAHCADVLQTEAEMMFAFMEDGYLMDGPLYNRGDLRAMLRLMNFFNVAVASDGKPIPHYDNL